MESGTSSDFDTTLIPKIGVVFSFTKPVSDDATRKLAKLMPKKVIQSTNKEVPKRFSSSKTVYSTGLRPSSTTTASSLAISSANSISLNPFPNISTDTMNALAKEYPSRLILPCTPKTRTKHVSPMTVVNTQTDYMYKLRVPIVQNKNEPKQQIERSYSTPPITNVQRNTDVTPDIQGAAGITKEQSDASNNLLIDSNKQLQTGIKKDEAIAIASSLFFSDHDDEDNETEELIKLPVKNIKVEEEEEEEEENSIKLLGLAESPVTVKIEDHKSPVNLELSDKNEKIETVRNKEVEEKLSGSSSEDDGAYEDSDDSEYIPDENSSTDENQSEDESSSKNRKSKRKQSEQPTSYKPNTAIILPKVNQSSLNTAPIRPVLIRPKPNQTSLPSTPVDPAGGYRPRKRSYEPYNPYTEQEKQKDVFETLKQLEQDTSNTDKKLNQLKLFKVVKTLQQLEQDSTDTDKKITQLKWLKEKQESAISELRIALTTNTQSTQPTAQKTTRQMNMLLDKNVLKKPVVNVTSSSVINPQQNRQTGISQQIVGENTQPITIHKTNVDQKYVQSSVQKVTRTTSSSTKTSSLQPIQPTLDTHIVMVPQSTATNVLGQLPVTTSNVGGNKSVTLPWQLMKHTDGTWHAVATLGTNLTTNRLVNTSKPNELQQLSTLVSCVKPASQIPSSTTTAITTQANSHQACFLPITQSVQQGSFNQRTQLAYNIPRLRLTTPLRSTLPQQSIHSNIRQPHTGQAIRLFQSTSSGQLTHVQTGKIIKLIPISSNLTNVQPGKTIPVQQSTSSTLTISATDFVRQHTPLTVTSIMKQQNKPMNINPSSSNPLRMSQPRIVHQQPQISVAQNVTFIPVGKITNTLRATNIMTPQVNTINTGKQIPAVRLPPNMTYHTLSAAQVKDLLSKAKQPVIKSCPSTVTVTSLISSNNKNSTNNSTNFSKPVTTLTNYKITPVSGLPSSSFSSMVFKNPIPENNNKLTLVNCSVASNNTKIITRAPININRGVRSNIQSVSTSSKQMIKTQTITSSKLLLPVVNRMSTTVKVQPLHQQHNQQYTTMQPKKHVSMVTAKPGNDQLNTPDKMLKLSLNGQNMVCYIPDKTNTSQHIQVPVTNTVTLLNNSSVVSDIQTINTQVQNVKSINTNKSSITINPNDIIPDDEETSHFCPLNSPFGLRDKLYRMSNRKRDKNRKFVANSNDKRFLSSIGFELCMKELSEPYFNFTHSKDTGISVEDYFKSLYNQSTKKIKINAIKKSPQRLMKVIEVLTSDEEQKEEKQQLAKKKKRKGLECDTIQSDLRSKKQRQAIGYKTDEDEQRAALEIADHNSCMFEDTHDLTSSSKHEGVNLHEEAHVSFVIKKLVADVVLVCEDGSDQDTDSVFEDNKDESDEDTDSACEDVKKNEKLSPKPQCQENTSIQQIKDIVCNSTTSSSAHMVSVSSMKSCCDTPEQLSVEDDNSSSLSDSLPDHSLLSPSRLNPVVMIEKMKFSKNM